jgi:cysteine desulfurase
MRPEIYLDNNATTCLLPEVREAMQLAMAEGIANPSSAHSAGERARVMIESARQALADFIAADAEQVFFTSGCTEANNTVLRSATTRRGAASRIVTTAVEHSSILKTCSRLADEGVDIAVLGVDREGRVGLKDLEDALRTPAALVSIQWVNNETGVIQDIEGIAAHCHRHGVQLHVDAAQAVGKLPVHMGKLPIDYLTFTGHKLHAPSGVGAIYSRDPGRLKPLLCGGGQEQGLRAGTENLIGIAGFGRAATIRRGELSQFIADMSSMRDAFESAVLRQIPYTSLNGAAAERVCNTTNIRFEGVNGQALIAQLDAHNIYCSQSSACTSSRPEPSYVLRAMGLNESEAYDSVRFSFSRLNRRDEVDHAVGVLADCCHRLRSAYEHGFDNLENSRV